MLGSMVRLAGVALWMLLVAGCTADEGERCSSSDDCAERLACVQSICRDASRYCHDEPSFAKSCAREGLCTLKGDACVAGSEADCRQSTRCKEYGYCKLAATCCSRDDGHCLSTEEHPLTHIERLSEDCAASRAGPVGHALRWLASARFSSVLTFTILNTPL